MTNLKDIIFNLACESAGQSSDRYVKIKQVKLSDIKEQYAKQDKILQEEVHE